MFTTARASAPSTQPTKSLSTSLPSEEAKTPEIETVLQSQPEIVAAEPAITAKQEAAEFEREEEKEIEEVDSLSIRAQRVKDSLQNKTVVKAVLLGADGSAQEIGYNTSSKQANQLLNGRPSIVGELESLNVIIARSLNQNASNTCVNPHILPAPFCNTSYKGPYLLYRVDAKGNTIDFEKSQYEKYVNENQALTESARKNFDPVDNQEIKAKSSFNSDSTLTLALLRSEVDKKIREEFKSEDRKPTQTAIEEAVDESLQRLVDQLSNACSKLTDPDYDPEEDIAKMKELYNIEQPDFEFDAGFDDDRDWRLQLNDALNYVRQRGRIDGRILADKISQTFYELNGEEASLDELTDVFRRIEGGLADEAEQDLRADSGDTGSALYLADKLGADLQNADPTDIVDISLRITGEHLVNQAKSSFNICKGRAPNDEELQCAVHKLAIQLADKAIQDSDDFDLDCDYDPQNADDGELFEEDQLEDDKWNNANQFEMKMLASEAVESKSGAATAYNVYFYEANAKRERKNLSAAIASFKKRNDRTPDEFEVDQIKQFLHQDKDTSLVKFELNVVSDTESHDEEEKQMEEAPRQKKVATTPSKVLVTPVKKKKTAARYNVYFESDALDKARNEKLAIKWFQRFNNREPSQSELAAIKQFIKSEKSQITEIKYDVPLEDVCQSAKTKTGNLVTKKSSTKYTLNFDDEEERENGDESQAVQWFKRFNNRAPTDEEKEKIKQFIKADDADTIDVD